MSLSLPWVSFWRFTAGYIGRGTSLICACLIWFQIEGPVSAAELVEILQRTMEEQGLAFGSDRAQREEMIRVDRRLREEQDAAYLVCYFADIICWCSPYVFLEGPWTIYGHRMSYVFRKTFFSRNNMFLGKLYANFILYGIILLSQVYPRFYLSAKLAQACWKC